MAENPFRNTDERSRVRFTTRNPFRTAERTPTPVSEIRAGGKEAKEKEFAAKQEERKAQTQRLLEEQSRELRTEGTINPFRGSKLVGQTAEFLGETVKGPDPGTIRQVGGFGTTAIVDWMANPANRLAVAGLGLGAGAVGAKKIWDLYRKQWTQRYGPQLAKKLSTGLQQIMPHEVNRGLIYGWGIPKKALGVKEGLDIQRLKGMEKVWAYGETLKALSQGEQRLIKTALEKPAGEGVEFGLSKAGRKVVRDARKDFMDLAVEARSLGLLNDESFARNYGQYLPRLYRSKRQYNAVLKKFGLTAPNRIKKDRWLQRKDIPDDIRLAMGEVQEAALPIMTGIAQESEAIAVGKSFNKLARMKDIVSDTPRTYRIREPQWYGKGVRKLKGEKPFEITVGKGAKAEKVQIEPNRNKYIDYEQIPNDPKKFFDLAGKYVRKDVAEEIVGAIRPLTEKNLAQKMYISSLGLWKYGKVLLNPGAWGRNTMSNMILNDMGGVPIHRWDFYKKAAGELANRGDLYKKVMKESNLLRGTYNRAEVQEMMRAMEGVEEGNAAFNTFDMWQKLMPSFRGKKITPAKIYESIEQWGKLTHVMYQVEKNGMSVKEATKSAEKWLFDYQKIPPFVKWWKNTIMGHPFATFEYKAAPRIAETLIKNPHRIAKYEMMFEGIERYGAARQGLSYDQLQEEKQNLPTWMKPQATLANEAVKLNIPILKHRFLRLPQKDKFGQSLYLDLQFIMPWGGLFNLSDKVMGNPYTAFFELMANHDSFTDRPIVPKGVKAEEVPEYYARFLAQKFLPPIAPGGSTFNALVNAITNKPTGLRRESVGSLGSAAGRLVGLKVRGVSPRIEKSRRAQEEADKERERRRRANREKALKKIQEQANQ
jgi:hypothetical protein